MSKDESGKPGKSSLNRHPNYESWRGMMVRCDNPDCKSYPDYGGRGIVYCERWKNFDAFCEDMGVRPSKDHSIDRIDNDAGYSLDNCKWSTSLEQALNRRAFSNSQTGYVGVYPRGENFAASFELRGVIYRHVGTFETPEEAFQAYLKIRELVLTGNGPDILKGHPTINTVVRGVFLDRESGQYSVRLTVKGKREHFGSFKTLEEARVTLKKVKADMKQASRSDKEKPITDQRGGCE